MKKMVNNDCTHLDADNDNKAKLPNFYQVVLFNDDFTPMGFVVDVLERIFFMDRRCATKTMLLAHQDGRATCGIFSKDIAQSKISQVMDHAFLSEHPLLCAMEAV